LQDLQKKSEKLILVMKIFTLCHFVGINFAPTTNIIESFVCCHCYCPMSHKLPMNFFIFATNWRQKGKFEFGLVTFVLGSTNGQMWILGSMINGLQFYHCGHVFLTLAKIFSKSLK
jgi:hypothetical protein